MGNGRIDFVDIEVVWALEQFIQLITVNACLPENGQLCPDRQIFFVQGDNNTVSCFRVNENMMTPRHAFPLEPEFFHEMDEIVEADVSNGPLRKAT